MDKEIFITDMVTPDDRDDPVMKALMDMWKCEFDDIKLTFPDPDPKVDGCNYIIAKLMPV